MFINHSMAAGGVHFPFKVALGPFLIRSGTRRIFSRITSSMRVAIMTQAEDKLHSVHFLIILARKP
jgi:hypothetical protein